MSRQLTQRIFPISEKSVYLHALQYSHCLTSTNNLFRETDMIRDPQQKKVYTLDLGLKSIQKHAEDPR